MISPGDSSEQDQPNQYLNQLRTDTEDLKLFYTEFIRVLLRDNPVYLQINQFISIMSQIKAELKGPQKVRIVEKAFSELSLSQAADDLSKHDTILTNTVKEFFLACSADVAPYFKSHPDYLPDPSHVEEQAIFASTRMMQALQSLGNQLPALQARYRQLADHFPRYQKMITRMGVPDFAIPVTTGLPGVPERAEVWENWPNLSDHDFLKSFQSAFNQFYISAAQFIADTPKATDPVIHQIVADYGEIMGAIIDSIQRLAAAGIDIKTIYYKLHHSETSKDDDTKALIEAVLINLLKQGLSGQSDRNLRYLLGLDKSEGI